MSTATLFGAPLGYTPGSLADWIRALENCWANYTTGCAPSALTADLERMREVFGHGASGKKLRDTVARLIPSEEDVELPAGVALPIEGTWLITPEGRILLDALYRLRRSGESVLDPSTQNRALATATQTRSDWYQAWATNQLSGTISASAIGAAVLILINGSTDYPSAFLLPNDEAARPQLRGTLLNMIGGFSVALGGERPATAPLRNHWAFTQVSRLLSRDIARQSDPDGARLYIRDGREEHLLKDLRDRLAKYPAIQAHDAVNGITDKYRENRGAFAAFGIMHERPTHTRHVLDSLLMKGPG